jgi:RNA polymerase sigma-70 factor (ECF subfamily)
MHESDVELMRRANRDDPGAFAELVHRYERVLRRVAESRLGTVEAAEDVVQETFLSAYKSRQSYDERFGFRTWLWTILLNQCRRYAGRQARHPRVVSMENQSPADTPASLAEVGAGEADSVLGGLMARERREILEQLLLKLSTVQADALRLRFFGGLKFQEIADTMQCSLCTAKNRVRWGLLKLAEFVQEEAREEAVMDHPAGSEHDISRGADDDRQSED